MQDVHTVKFLEAGAPQVVPVFVVYVKTILVQTVQCKMVTWSNYKFERLENEVAVRKSKILFWQLPGGTEKNHKTQ
jgi:hypothetical protein